VSSSTAVSSSSVRVVFALVVLVAGVVLGGGIGATVACPGRDVAPGPPEVRCLRLPPGGASARDRVWRASGLLYLW